jgi:hypothetical protein
MYLLKFSEKVTPPPPKKKVLAENFGQIVIEMREIPL